MNMVYIEKWWTLKIPLPHQLQLTNIQTRYEAKNSNLVQCRRPLEGCGEPRQGGWLAARSPASSADKGDDPRLGRLQPRRVGLPLLGAVAAPALDERLP